MRRLLLVDDHASSRQPLALLLTLALEYDEVVQVGTAAEALAVLDGVEVAIVDLGLPDGDGVALIRQIRSSVPSIRVLVLTSSSDRMEAARSIAAGAKGVLHKAADIDEIVEAVRSIGEGRSLVTAQQRDDLGRLAAVGTHPPAYPLRERDRLTPRERDVLQALADGLSDKEIAFHLQIGIETVRTHVASIYRKFGVESRVQALKFALRHGLVTDETPHERPK
jgi:DNA-binding NarL/FixJ family response regulator